MAQQHEAERVRREIIRLTQAGLDFRALQGETLKRLRKVIPIEAAFFATVDPATLLFTSAMSDDILQQVTPQFIENEFLQDDVNKFVALARSGSPVGSLFQVTHQRVEQSQRYREVLAPLGLGDELRAALITRDVCWGVLCLHRERTSPPFGPAEAAFLRRIAPSLAEGLRSSLLLGAATTEEAADAPGLLLLAEDHSIAAITPIAERLLAGVAVEDRSPVYGLPYAVHAVAARLRAAERGSEEEPELAHRLAPWVRLRTAAGQWLILHASRMTGAHADGQIAVIVEVARPVEIAQLIVQVYALSRRESEIVRLVAQGLTTTEIAKAFHITANTVQDHLKAIFEKVGVRSRRELVSQLFAQQYQPRMAAGRDPGADGWFA
jgi:DNA-binding CsgD family transcriptional regulator/GAF domain-containing protein